MKVIGLTGNIAAGKSTVAKMFGKLGAEILDADQIARDILNTEADLLSEIIECFGNDILDSNGKLDRKKLGKIVFNDESRKKILESIMHPVITKEATNRILQFAKGNSNVVIYEAALLVETGHYKEMDSLVVVTAKDSLRIKRLVRRNSLSFNDARQRLLSQLSQYKKISLADYIIENSDTLENTQQQVKKVWERICQQ